MLQRTKPMRRSSAPMRSTGIKSRPAPPRPALQESDYQPDYSKANQTRSKRKDTGRTDQKALDACRGQPCYLRIPGICLGPHRTDTTVPAHQNEGKGMGLKVPDLQSVPACFACHSEYDQGHLFTREEKRGFFYTAHGQWQPVRQGLIGR